MQLDKQTAQKIVDKHGISWSRNEVGMSVECRDAKGTPFTIVQLNSGAIRATDFTGKIFVSI